MFKSPFSFEGRIRRLEYGLSQIIYTIAVMLISTLSDKNTIISPIILLIAYIPLVWFILAQGTKRCHDRGNSGWWQIIPLYSLWMLFADGSPEINNYGPSPKHRAEQNEIDQIGKDLEV